MSSPKDRAGDLRERERQELERILDSRIFTPSSHAASLLRFVCERHFENTRDAITEYDIAVNALARRPDFDPRTDSIVRVEAHRVRKRLREYYENKGACHTVRIVLPPGSYAPEFVHLENTPPAPPEVPVEGPKPQGRCRTTLARLGAQNKRSWIAASILLAGLAAGVPWLLVSRQKAASPQPAGAPSDNSRAAAGALPGDTVRILAGRASGEYVDRTGTRWMADRFFRGGSTAAVRYHSLALADDPAIYQYCRIGEDFSYDIPLQPGVYEMRLMFAESAETVVVDDVGDGRRTFHVLANGVQILPPRDGRHIRGMDIHADAGGSEIANVKVFKDVTPASDGQLHLRFVGRSGRALLNAIEIVPGLKGKLRPLRWRAQETPYTDHSGNIWLADRYVRGGRLSRFRAIVSRTPDPLLYEGERFGAFTYVVPVATGTSYTVRLHFAESYFGGFAKPISPPRMFSVYANHNPLLRDFVVLHAAGGASIALQKTFRGIKPSPFDKIVLSFEPINEYAIVNAIEVEDEAK